MASVALVILNTIKSDLQTIVSGNTTDIQGSEYTYQTSLGANVVTGLALSDVEVSTYPAASINGVVGNVANIEQIPDIDIVTAFSVEAADLLNGRDWLTVADQMCEDIRAAVDLNMRRASLHAKILQPSAPGRPAFEYLPERVGSDLVVIRRWYHIRHAEQYPMTNV